MIKHNLQEVQKRFENIKNKVMLNRKHFFEQNKEEIDVAAHRVVLMVVYAVYKPEEYRRTRNLFESVDTQLLDEETEGVVVFISPAKVAGRPQS